jgi:hypothetical protein
MSQKKINSTCECCKKEVSIWDMNIVCSDCLHTIRNEKQKEELFKIDWEDDKPEPCKKIICHPKDWDMKTEDENETQT